MHFFNGAPKLINGLCIVYWVSVFAFPLGFGVMCGGLASSVWETHEARIKPAAFCCFSCVLSASAALDFTLAHMLVEKPLFHHSKTNNWFVTLGIGLANRQGSFLSLGFIAIAIDAGPDSEGVAIAALILFIIGITFTSLIFSE